MLMDLTETFEYQPQNNLDDSIDDDHEVDL